MGHFPRVFPVGRILPTGELARFRFGLIQGRAKAGAGQGSKGHVGPVIFGGERMPQPTVQPWLTEYHQGKGATGTAGPGGSEWVTGRPLVLQQCLKAFLREMSVVRQEGIAEVLTHDNHFTQEGFVILL